MAGRKIVDPGAVAARIREKLARVRLLASQAAEPDVGMVLRQRARELAQTIEPPEEGERLEVVEFVLGEERFAFESAWVTEAVRPRETTLVPGALPSLAGLVNLRGRVLSILDLRPLLGISSVEGVKVPVVLVLADAEGEVGIAADRVEAVRELPRRDLAPPPATLPEPARRYRRGLLPGGLSLLDARRFLLPLPGEHQQHPEPS